MEGGWVLGHSHLVKDGYRYRNIPNELEQMQKSPRVVKPTKSQKKSIEDDEGESLQKSLEENQEEALQKSPEEIEEEALQKRKMKEKMKEEYDEALQNPPLDLWGGPQAQFWKTFLPGFSEEECGPGSGKCFGGVDPPPSFIPNYVLERSTAELIVCDAGLAEVNGKYCLNKKGKHCGMPEWKQDGGPWLLFWAGDHQGGWIIGNSHTGPECFYYSARPKVLAQVHKKFNGGPEYQEIVKTPPEDLVDGPPERGWITFVPFVLESNAKVAEPEAEPSTIRPLQCRGGVDPPPIIVPVLPPPEELTKAQESTKKEEPKKKAASKKKEEPRK